MWRAIRKLGWTPQSDVFDRIGDKDVVNIYTPQNIQIFQNLNFFDWVTLTLEDLYGTPWHGYSRREAKCAELAYQNALEVFTGVRTATYSPDIPEHYVEEVGTEGETKFYIKIHTASPLRQNGQIVGLLAINRCREWDGVPCTVPLSKSKPQKLKKRDIDETFRQMCLRYTELLGAGGDACESVQ